MSSLFSCISLGKKLMELDHASIKFKRSEVQFLEDTSEIPCTILKIYGCVFQNQGSGILSHIVNNKYQYILKHFCHTNGYANLDKENLTWMFAIFFLSMLTYNVRRS